MFLRRYLACLGISRKTLTAPCTISASTTWKMVPLGTGWDLSSQLSSLEYLVCGRRFRTNWRRWANWLKAPRRNWSVGRSQSSWNMRQIVKWTRAATVSIRWITESRKSFWTRWSKNWVWMSATVVLPSRPLLPWKPFNTSVLWVSTWWNCSVCPSALALRQLTRLISANGVRSGFNFWEPKPLFGKYRMTVTKGLSHRFLRRKTCKNRASLNKENCADRYHLL